MRYLLDTNICIYLMNHRPPGVVERFQRLSYGDVVVSVVTLAELRHGIERCAELKPVAEQALSRLLEHIPAVPFDQAAAVSYGVIAAAVCDRRRDALDRLIAAHALSLSLIVVTNNEADFNIYPGLLVENWVDR